jgi:hypothetical protein
MGSMMSARRRNLYVQSQDISDAPPWATELAARRSKLSGQEKADCVRKLQTEHGWTYAKVAKLFGVTTSAVGLWLRLDAPEERARANEQAKEYRERNKYRVAGNQRMGRDRKWHGPGVRSAMWKAQDGKCYLCDRPLGPELMAVVEHDHRCCPQNRSCEVCRRGLACNACNHIIGFAHDDPDLLERIAANLRPAVAMVTARLAALNSDNAPLLDGD